jgi:hypothetical protein
MSNAVVRRANQVVDDLAGWVMRKPAYPYGADERRLIVEHYSEIGELFNAFRLVGAGKFLYSKETVPVRLVDKDGKSTLLVVGLLSEHVFNTRVLNANARAVNILKSMLLPSMANVNELPTLPVTSFGLLVVYSSEEFGADDSRWPEFLVFVAPWRHAEGLLLRPLRIASCWTLPTFSWLIGI